MQHRFLLLISVCFLTACSEQFDLNAPYEDIWVVYGLLNPDDSVQYIRISRAFQVDGDAFEYAANHDLTEKALSVSLKGNGIQYDATQLDSVSREEGGDFFPYMTVYRFASTGEQRLVPGQIYELEIRSSRDTSFLLRAKTRIPPKPELILPRLTGSGSEQCLPVVPFEDSVRVLFRKRSHQSEVQAAAYEIHVSLAYRENGEAKSYTFGPTPQFSANQKCTGAGVDNLCYQFSSGAVINGMRSRLKDPMARYSYQSFPTCGIPADLSKAVRLQVTAVDTQLYRYMLANNPRFFNINTVRQEYTNIEGSARAVGILGAIASSESPVALSDCAQYLLRLNGAEDPGNCE